MPAWVKWALGAAVVCCLWASSSLAAERFSAPKKAVEPVDLYRAGIAAMVQENWEYRPEDFRGSSRERVSITFQVLPDGTLTEIAILNSSGNPHLERSAMEAVVRSSPVAPHPPGLHLNALDMGITFHSHFRRP